MACYQNPRGIFPNFFSLTKLTVLKCFPPEGTRVGKLVNYVKIPPFSPGSGKDAVLGHIQNCPQASTASQSTALGQFWICPRPASFPESLGKKWNFGP